MCSQNVGNERGVPRKSRSPKCRHLETTVLNGVSGPLFLYPCCWCSGEGVTKEAQRLFPSSSFTRGWGRQPWWLERLAMSLRVPRALPTSAHDSCPRVCKEAAPAAITSSPHCYRRKPAGATEPLFPFEMSGLTSLARLAHGHLWLQGSKSGYQGLPEKKKSNTATVDPTPGCPFT